MKVLVALLICFAAYNGQTQNIAIPGQKNINMMDRNMVYRKLIVLVISVTNGKDTTTRIASAFYINENYIGTCFHVYDANDGWKTLNIMAYINPKLENGQVISVDTVTAIISKPELKDQYDFTTHRFDPDDAVTDFLILKLTRKIKSEKNVFVRNWFKNQVKLVAGSPVRFDRSVNPNTADFVPLFTTLNGSTSLSIGGISNLNQGSSGSAMFDSDGNVVAMMQSGTANVASSKKVMQNLLLQGKVGKWHLDATNHYLNQNPNSSIGFAIQINYLIDKYGRGYFE